MPAEEEARIRRDQPFRKPVGLDEEEPVVDPRGDVLVDRGENRERRRDVEKREPGDPLGVV
jgi:hypothetical protein